jgi:hypothetical protein
MSTQPAAWSFLAGQTLHTIQGAPFDVVRVSDTTITVRPHRSRRDYAISIQRELEPALDTYREGRFFPRPSDLYLVPVRRELAAYVWGVLRAVINEHMAIMGPDKLIFRVSNHHTPSCGRPPTVDGDEPSAYHGYFENSDGEQFIFVYDRATKQGTLWCGDAGWEHPYPVTEGPAPIGYPDSLDGLILSEPEQAWLRACWAAATGGRL